MGATNVLNGVQDIDKYKLMEHRGVPQKELLMI